MKLKNKHGRASAKKKQNVPKPKVSEAPFTFSEPLIDNLVVDNKDLLTLGLKLPSGNRVNRLLKLIDANRHVHLKNSKKMLQLGEAFSGSPQLLTKFNLVTFLIDLQQTSKTIYPKHKFYLDLLFSYSRRQKPSVCLRKPTF